MRSTVLAVAFSTMSVLACGSDTPTGNGTPTVASVVVTPGNATLVSLGEIVQLTASARDASGNAISGKTFTWSPSDVSVATVDATGLVTAVANGAVTITATTDGISGSAAITVTQAVASVAVTPNSATLVSLGETVQLTGSAQDASGNTISGKTFIWSSSGQSVATVSSSGLVTAVVTGSATITATTEGIGGTATILVEQVGAELVFTVEPADVVVDAAIAPAVQVAIRDALGSTVLDAADAVTLALVANNSGATLSGTTIVDAVSGVASFDALVIDKAGLDYALVATSGTVESMTSASFLAAFQWPGNGHLYIPVLATEGISWTDANIAAETLGAEWHLATVTSAEENAFLFDLVDDDPAFWNCCLSNNSAGPWLGGLLVGPTPNDYAWVTGESFVYTNWGPLEPFGNGDRIGFFGFRASMGPHWNDVPADRPEYGYILERPGNGTPTVASVVVTPGNATLVSLGEIVQLTASARDASGNAISGKTFTWSSSDQTIATVSPTGLVTAIANGVATITATTDNVSGTADLTITLEEIDQQQTVIDVTVGGLTIGGASDQILAQVVTAGRSGFLEQVRFPVACTTGDLTVEIQGVDAITPNGVVLTSEIILGESLPSFSPDPPSFRGLTFSSPISFTAGALFAIVLKSAGQCLVFQGPVGNPYPGGDAFFDSRPNPPGVWIPISVGTGREDLPFQTVVR